MRCSEKILFSLLKKILIGLSQPTRYPLTEKIVNKNSNTTELDKLSKKILTFIIEKQQGGVRKTT